MAPRFSRPHIVIFDLDGTLIDTAPDLAWAVDATLAELQLPARGVAQVSLWLGNGVVELLKRALTGRMDGTPDAALLAAALPRFRRHYAAHFHVHSRLYPGVVEGLRALASAEIHCACVTNKASAFTEPLLASFGIGEYLPVIVSGDTLPERKPDPTPLYYAVRQFAVDAPQVIVVGDSVNDVQAARRAGFPVVCTSYGYNHGHDIRTAQPDAVVDSLAELPALFGLPAAAPGA